MPESLSQQTLKNALWQVFNLFWVTLLNLFVTPLLLKRFGIENYGVYVLILTILSFLSLLDFGMGAGFTSSFIEYTVKGEHDKRERLVNSFFMYWLAVGLVGLVFLFAASFFADSFWGVKIEFLRQARIGFWFAGFYFLLTTIGSLFLSMAVSLRRFDIIGKVAFLQNTFLSVFLVIVALLRPSLTWLMASHFVVSFIGLGAYFVMTKKSFPDLKLKLEFHKSEFYGKTIFSFFSFIFGLANNSLLQIDRFFVSRILGNAMLGYYAIPNNLAQKIYSISTSGAMTLFPVASHLTHGEETEKLRHTFRRAMKLGIIFSVFSGSILLIFGHTFLYFWVGQDIARVSAGLLNYFVPTYVLMSIYMIVSNFYLGMGKSKTLASFSAFMAFLNIVFLIFMVPRFGITGAAISYLLAVLPVLFFWAFFEVKKLGAKNFFNFYGKLFLKLGVVLIILFVASKIFFLNLAVNLWLTLLVMIMGFVSILMLYFILGFVDTEDRELIRTLLYGSAK